MNKKMWIFLIVAFTFVVSSPLFAQDLSVERIVERQI